jgi:uncharacterized membrane protein (UPF0127 family)
MISKGDPMTPAQDIPVPSPADTQRWWLLADGRTDAVARVSRADSFWSRFVGLLGRSTLADDDGLWIEPCTSVHTFFMRFPIDLAFVDRRGIVIRRVDRLPPWRATAIQTRARACVELAAGVLEKTGVTVGTHLTLARNAQPDPGPVAS